VRVREPMQKGRVFLAGDAAHMVTSAGGKGMNMAILDANELASALCEHYGNLSSEDRLASYTHAGCLALRGILELDAWIAATQPCPAR
jgi:p-hydroxybenzoate 3-monooxygenase